MELQLGSSLSSTPRNSLEPSKGKGSNPDVPIVYFCLRTPSSYPWTPQLPIPLIHRHTHGLNTQQKSSPGFKDEDGVGPSVVPSPLFSASVFGIQERTFLSSIKRETGKGSRNSAHVEKLSLSESSGISLETMQSVW